MAVAPCITGTLFRHDERHEFYGLGLYRVSKQVAGVSGYGVGFLFWQLLCSGDPHRGQVIFTFVFSSGADAEGHVEYA